MRVQSSIYSIDIVIMYLLLVRSTVGQKEVVPLHELRASCFRSAEFLFNLESIFNTFSSSEKASPNPRLRICSVEFRVSSSADDLVMSKLGILFPQASIHTQTAWQGMSTIISNRDYPLTTKTHTHFNKSRQLFSGSSLWCARNDMVSWLSSHWSVPNDGCRQRPILGKSVSCAEHVSIKSFVLTTKHGCTLLLQQINWDLMNPNKL